MGDSSRLLVDGEPTADLPAQVVLISMGTAGDLYPFMALALALREAGHPISFMAAEVHRQAVSRIGIDFYPLGTAAQYEAVLHNPLLWHPRKGFEVVWQAAEPTLTHIPAWFDEHSSGRRMVVVAHPLALPAVDLARASHSELTVVAAYLAPSNLRTVYDLPSMGNLPIPDWMPRAIRRFLWRQVDQWVLDPITLPGIDAARAAHGLPAVDHFFDYLNRVADRSVTLFPSWFADIQPDWPSPIISGDFPLFEPDQAVELPAEVQRFLDEGEPPVVFTAGTGQLHAEQYFSNALAVTRRIGRRALLLTRHRDQVPQTLGPTACWQPYLPLKLLLPRAAALVHHGGIGTTAEALRAGIPQLVVPLAHDQFDNAARVRRLGAGLTINATRLSPRTLGRQLSRLLSSPVISQRCREIAERFTGNRSIAKISAAIVAP